MILQACTYCDFLTQGPPKRCPHCNNMSWRHATDRELILYQDPNSSLNKKLKKNLKKITP